MKTFFLFWIFSWLLGSTLGRIAVGLVVLWYLDDRYFGLLAALWAPVARSQRRAALRGAVEINPADVRSMVELGEICLRGGKYQEAADYLQRAVDRGEESARATYLLGGVLVKLGRHAEGRNLLEQAVAKQPSVAFGEPYIFLLEEALAAEGAQSPRVESLVSAVHLFDSVEVLTRAGRLLGQAGRSDLARKLLTEAVETYRFTPKKMRRRERRWMMRARLGLLRLK